MRPQPRHDLCTLPSNINHERPARARALTGRSVPEYRVRATGQAYGRGAACQWQYVLPTRWRLYAAEGSTKLRRGLVEPLTKASTLGYSEPIRIVPPMSSPMHPRRRAARPTYRDSRSADCQGWARQCTYPRDATVHGTRRHPRSRRPRHAGVSHRGSAGRG